MIRHPAVAGQFYPESRDDLKTMVSGFIGNIGFEEDVVGIVSPHAGYVYSGGIAGQTFAGIRIPERVVILGPNHHGIGHPASLYSEGSWVTPLGETMIDTDLAGRILKGCPQMSSDVLAHKREHSLEVQLPFVQVKNPLAKIIPICLSHAPFAVLQEMGIRLGEILSAFSDNVLIVASSDMTHYEPGNVARNKDMRALEHLLALDPEGLYRTVYRDRITMCGVIPAVVMLYAAKSMGAIRGRLVRYGNSGEVTGDQSQVVGYAGVHIFK